MVAGRMLLGILVGVNDYIFNVQWSHDRGIPSKHVDYTLVTLMLGDDMGAGGHEPTIELLDDKGLLVGTRISRDHNTISKNNNLDDHIIKIMHDKHENPMETPKYVTLYQWSKDAVCISAIQISNGKLSAVLFGDVAARCGQSWFLSRRRLDRNLPHPKCVWLDADHTVNFNARTMSFHLPDFIGTPDKVKMYREKKDYMCKSVPRLAFWMNLWEGSEIPIFKPPLEYLPDAITGLGGRDKDPDRAIDTLKWDMNADKDPEPLGKRSPTSFRISEKRKKVKKRSGTNLDTSRLIITRAEGHEASLVCNSTSSYGYDVVSLREKTYCDMTVKRLYNLCDSIYKTNCFDVERKVLVGHGGVNARGEVSAVGVPVKRYNSADHWEE
ncbi:hypothetical protein LX32DRAFT_718446 [Colletotrichum zoysiae]|uniref:Uncharacterized protein n=1 Tax=Colletotrichum zoysiae TaxID=1216348 RepID=A0AAD9HIN4_9PEZI|nr:hypothetical protein LX32DRAFT_718446 [Colletotrichum zoysiae]